MPQKKSSTEATTIQKRVASSAGSYEDFISSLELVGLAVADAQYRVDRGAYFEHKDQEQVLEVKAEQTDLDDSSFDITATLELSVGSKKTGSKDLEIRVTYLMHIHSKPPMNKLYVERFANREIRLIIWPYLREFVTSACAKMYVPPIFLPLPGAKS